LRKKCKKYFAIFETFRENIGLPCTTFHQAGVNSFLSRSYTDITKNGRPLNFPPKTKKIQPSTKSLFMLLVFLVKIAAVVLSGYLEQVDILL